MKYETRRWKIAELKMAVGLVLVAALTIPADVSAHWCSNIYRTYARIVVKPEREQIDIAVGETGTLKVRVRNNFPYSLQWVRLNVEPTSDLEVVGITTSHEEAQVEKIHSGEEVTFTVTIRRVQAGDDHVSNLNLSVAVRRMGVGNSYRYIGDDLLDPELNEYWQPADNPEPDPQDVRNAVADQSRSLNWSKLADIADYHNCPECELDGVNGLVELWTYYNGEFNDTLGQQRIRGGQALAIRLRFRPFNNPSRASVVSDMIGVMDSTDALTRGLATFYAAYGGNDPGVSTRIQTIASSDPSNSAQRMAKAALLMLGEDYQGDVDACWRDAGEEHMARVVCAAAIGVMGNDTPITDFLMSQVSDGSDEDYPRLFASYILQLVVLSRRQGPEGVGAVSFLEYEEVIDDDVPPRAPTGLTVQPAG